MRTQARPFLPAVPVSIEDVAVRQYLDQLHRALEAALLDIYTDFASGASTLTTFTALPTATTLPENQLGLRTDAGNHKIYANIDGTIESAGLS